MRLRIKVTLRAVVDVAANGSVSYAPAIDGDDVLKAVREQHTPEQLAALLAHATRCRLDEGLVRIDRGSTWDPRLTYAEYVRSTKRHHVVRVDGVERKYRREGGAIVGGASAYHNNQIRREDLDALNARERAS